jgi:glycosyltransferase involved in cell wall biosynthesis
MSPLSRDPRARLVFAGELARDEFGVRLERAIATSGCRDRIAITGYLSEERYVEYLRAADVAVQLRTKSRGGTPRGVLDCLSHGLAVAVNDDASYRDYPDDAVIKLRPDPTVGEIAAMLTRAFEDRSWLEQTARTGLRYVFEHHDAAQCAAAYAAALHEFSERKRLAQGRYWVEALAPHVAGTEDVGAAMDRAVAWLYALPRPRFGRRRVWIDATRAAHTDKQTGVDRVVRQTVRAAYCTERAGIEPVAVELREGVLKPATEWLGSQGLLVDEERGRDPEPIEFSPGDVLLMLDASWARFADFHAAFRKARAARTTIATAIYDLLPLTLPEGNIVEGGREWFDGWLRDAIAQSDALVCISRAVADELIRYLDAQKLWRPGLRVGFWHLGSNFTVPRGGAGPDSRTAFVRDTRYVLMVGTIEPRKSHAAALDALETLWRQGDDLALVIAGAEGWMVSGLMTRLRQHPERGKRLFLLEHPTDQEIADLYEHAYGLLFLSKGEGFGLPLVEAASHGVPIVCSDLPVFREVAGDFATYVDADDAGILASQLTAWLRRRRANDVPDSRAMPRLTWEQSADALLRVVVDGEWYRESN